nr:MAG: hypothetical protein H4Rhizo43738_000003 [Mitovirus sp.]
MRWVSFVTFGVLSTSTIEEDMSRLARDTITSLGKYNGNIVWNANRLFTREVGLLIHKIPEWGILCTGEGGS